MLIQTQMGNIVNFDNFDTIKFRLKYDETIDMCVEIYASKDNAYVVLGKYVPLIDEQDKNRSYDDDEFRDKLFRKMRGRLRQSAAEELERIYAELKTNGYCEMDNGDCLVAV